MKFTKVFVTECCDFEAKTSWEHEALKALLDHIRKKHPGLILELEEEGRQAAMSQNGRGYHDSGKGQSGGWSKALPSFREAWTREALKRRLSL